MWGNLHAAFLREGVVVILASLPDQFTKTKGFEKRAQCYAAKAYSSQADQGDDYHNLKEIIFIAVADCIIFPDKSEYKSNHVILDQNSFEHDLKDFQFIFIELPKFPKSREEQLEKSPIIKLAYDELDKFHWNEKDLLAYEERVMDFQKEAAILEQKLDDAKLEGRQEGIQIGQEKGKIEGIAEGEQQAKIAVAGMFKKVCQAEKKVIN